MLVGGFPPLYNRGMVSPPSTPQKFRLHPQVVVMFLLTLMFIGGVTLYAVLPAGPLRVMGITLLCGVIVYRLFKLEDKPSRPTSRPISASTSSAPPPPAA